MQLHDAIMFRGMTPDGTIVVHEGPASTWGLGIIPSATVRAQLVQVARSVPTLAGYGGTLVWGA